MDEPFAALDEVTRVKLNNELLALKTRLETTIVFVTHSVGESVYLSTRIVVLAAKGGEIVDQIQVEPGMPRDTEYRLGPVFSQLRVAPRTPCAAPWEDGHERVANEFARCAGGGRAAPVRLRRLSALWEALVRLRGIPPYVLPAPSIILQKLIEDRELLFSSLLVTLSITLQALTLATVCGVLLALAMAQSKWLARTLTPYAIMLQVTPIVAIAPLLLVYLSPPRAVLVCAFLVAFFPILSNTALGLASVDHALLDLFDLYRASAWRRLIYLRAPAALPQFLAGLRIAGGSR